MQNIPSFDIRNPKRFPEQLIQTIEAIYSVRITIHDLRGVLEISEGEKLLDWGRMVHLHPYCLEGRMLHAGWNRKCLRDCAAFAETEATRSRQPFLHECWKGCRELVVPVWEGNYPVLVLYAGAFFPQKETAAKRSLPEQIRKSRQPLSKETLTALAHLLPAAGMALLHEAAMLRKQRTPEENRTDEIRNWVREHFRENISLEPLAEQLKLSPSRTGHVISILFGCSLKELVQRERMRYAAHLLETTALPIKEIASRSGPDNPYYFTRRFRLFHGIPPGEFRRRAKNRIFTKKSRK